MDNKHGKIFVIKQSKGCKFMPKCTKICFAAGLCPDLLGQLVLFPDPLAAMGAYF